MLPAGAIESTKMPGLDYCCALSVYKDMSRSLLAIACCAAAGVLSAQAPPEPVVRALAPILKDARAHIPSRVAVEPATLPPSPITGRNSTLVAFSIGRKAMSLEQGVIDLIDRLLAWDSKQPLPAADRAVVVEWIEALRADVSGRMNAGGGGKSCDNDCLVGHLTAPGSIFGDSRDEQVETRNEVLLTTLSAAVRD